MSLSRLFSTESCEEWIVSCWDNAAARSWREAKKTFTFTLVGWGLCFSAQLSPPANKMLQLDLEVRPKNLYKMLLCRLMSKISKVEHHC